MIEPVFSLFANAQKQFLQNNLPVFKNELITKNWVPPFRPSD